MTTSDDAKALAERRWAMSLLNEVAPAAVDSVESQRPPEPDVRFRVEGRLVGLELTRVFRPHSGSGQTRKEVESLRARVVERAVSIWEDDTNIVVDVATHFQSQRAFYSGDVERLAQSLVRIVRNNLPVSELVGEEEYDYINRAWYPEEFVHVRVLRHEALTANHWHTADADSVPELEPAQIQAAIDSKMSKPANYETDYAEKWLGIVLEQEGLSSMLDVPPSVGAQTYVTPFDRAYLLQPRFGDRVTRLRVTLPRPIVGGGRTPLS